MRATTWTSFKARLQPGAKIFLLNIRQPWRSRHVTISERSRRSMTVRDSLGQRAVVPLPTAAFTHVVDNNEIELLSKTDGPRFNDKRVMYEQVGIPAGQPYLVLRIVADVGEQ
jgi:hypothetical protein